MSYWPAASGNQIDMADAIVRAYRNLLDRPQLAVELGWLPWALIVGTEFLAFILAGGGIFGLLLSSLVRGAGFLVFGTVFVVRWQRLILLEEVRSDTLFPPGWAPSIIAVIKLGLLILLGFIVLSVLAALPPHVLTGPLAVIGGIALALASLRFSLVFPAAAIEHPMDFRTAWDRLTGNYWRLLGCTIACSLPFGIAQAILNKIAFGSSWVVLLILQAVSLAVVFAGTAVIAGLQADIYRRIVGPPPTLSPR